MTPQIYFYIINYTNPINLIWIYIDNHPDRFVL